MMSLILGTKLAQLRKTNGLSQEALAEKLGISRQAVSKWERGESSPDTDTLIELAALYKVSLDELVGNKAPEEKAVNPTTVKTKKEKSKKTEVIEKAPALYPGLSSKLLRFPLPLIIIVLYVASGLALNLWHPMWLLFLLIPAYYHFALGARAVTQRGFLLGLPVIELALILFLLSGFLLNAWKYAWLLFVLTIIYYWTIALYVKK